MIQKRFHPAKWPRFCSPIASSAIYICNLLSPRNLLKCKYFCTTIQWLVVYDLLATNNCIIGGLTSERWVTINRICRCRLDISGWNRAERILDIIAWRKYANGLSGSVARKVFPPKNIQTYKGWASLLMMTYIGRCRRESFTTP